MCQLLPKSISHISHPLLCLYKYQCNFQWLSSTSTLYSNEATLITINSQSVHLCLFHSKLSNIQQKQKCELPPHSELTHVVD